MQQRFRPATRTPETQKPAVNDTIANELEAMIPQIQRSLPQMVGLTADRMARIILTEVRKNPKLAECDRKSFFGSIMECAQLGLEPGGILQQAFLIPRKNSFTEKIECNLQIGYQGYIELAERDGRITLIAHAVYEGETFDIDYGTNERLIHKPCIHGEPGKIIGAYAIAKYKDGRTKFLFLNIAKIEEAKKRSQAKKSSPWNTDYDAMAIKTAIRRLFKFLPKSPAIARALELEDAIDVEASEPEIEYPTTEVIESTEVEQVDPMEGGDK